MRGRTIAGFFVCAVVLPTLAFSQGLINQGRQDAQVKPQRVLSSTEAVLARPVAPYARGATIMSRLVLAQTPSQSPVVAQSPTLTNQDVITLVKNKFSDDLILAQIGNAKVKSFDLTTSGLIALKAAGVSERVLTAMINAEGDGKPQAPGPSPSATPITQVAIVGPSTTSVTGREAGIYLQGDGKELISLEPTVFSGGKTGGVLKSALTYGLAKTSWKAVVRSPQANQQIPDGMPVFYFYFERAGSGLSGSFFGATSPNEFVLAKMKATDSERELVVGEFGALGSSTGARSKDSIPLHIEKIQPGVYRVFPQDALPEGEYCFFYAAGAPGFMTAGIGKLFDFGVHPKRSSN